MRARTTACARTSTRPPWRSASTESASAAAAAPAVNASSAASRYGSLRNGTRLTYHSTFAQHDDGVAVGPGKAFRRRFPPWQPGMRDMLRRRERHRQPPRQREAEYALGVVRHPGAETVAPLRVNLESV